MKINAYLNELSFEVTNPDDWATRFDNAISCLNILSKIKIPIESISTIIHSRIFLSIVIEPSTKFTELLDRDKGRKKSFTAIYKTAVKDYLFMDSKAQYYVGDQNVSQTSIADSYESQKSGAITILINFSPTFPSPTVDIIKKEDGSQTIMSYHSVEALTTKLQELKILRTFYDKRSNTRPNDSLTILSDTSLFIPTEYGNRKSRLYRRIGHEDELWCLDRFHRGNSIHLEVFSESKKKQIAVSCHDEINFFRELNSSEKNRTLIIERMP